MNMKKKKAVAFVVALFLLVALEIVYIFSELYTENDKPGNNTKITDSIKFKKEYESLNGTDNGSGKLIRALSINEENPFIYSTAEEIVSKMDNKENFIVYFGFAKCPWCRSVLIPFMETAKDLGIDKVYYVDVLDIRDTYELDENNKAVRVKEGSDAYYSLLKKMSNVLSDYSPLTYDLKGKEKEVIINEKRIYAPNMVIVKNGKAIAMEEGIIEELKDPYMEITDGMNCKIKEKFRCFLEKYEAKEQTCSIKQSKC